MPPGAAAVQHEGRASGAGADAAGVFHLLPPEPSRNPSVRWGALGVHWKSGCCSLLPREPEVWLRAAVATLVGSAGSGSDTESHLERGWEVWEAICQGVVALGTVLQTVCTGRG